MHLLILLLVNELIINAYQQAFKNQEKGLITIKGEQKEDALRLSVTDNVVGLDPDQWENLKSLAGSLSNSLIKQLYDQLDIRLNGGTTFVVDISQDSLI